MDARHKDVAIPQFQDGGQLHRNDGWHCRAVEVGALRFLSGICDWWWVISAVAPLATPDPRVHGEVQGSCNQERILLTPRKQGQRPPGQPEWALPLLTVKLAAEPLLMEWREENPRVTDADEQQGPQMEVSSVT